MSSASARFPLLCVKIYGVISALGLEVLDFYKT